MWTNKTTHFVELQKLYLNIMFKDFNNITLSHKISVTIFGIFKKRAFFTVVFHVLEKFMQPSEKKFFCLNFFLFESY
jgi:hypothetical protein